MPGLPELAKRGLLDARVIASVARLTSDEWLEKSTEDEQEDSIQAYVDALVAGFPRQAQDPGSAEWKPSRLAVTCEHGDEDCDDAVLKNLDQRDRDRLEDLVMHVRTAEEITAAVEHGDHDMKGQASDLDSLAEFRDDRDGAAAGDDGGDVEREAERAAAG